MHAALVFRGGPETARKFLDAQDRYFIERDAQKNDGESGTDESPVTPEEILKRANDNLGGSGDHYTVKEAYGNE